jgi:hypothetical protein
MNKYIEAHQRRVESALDMTQGYDAPISPRADRVIKMCQHYFQTFTDEQIGQVADLIHQIAKNNMDAQADKGKLWGKY